MTIKAGKIPEGMQLITKDRRAELEGESDYWRKELARFRTGIRGALSPSWKSNPGVSDTEIIAKITELEADKKRLHWLLNNLVASELRDMGVEVPYDIVDINATLEALDTAIKETP
jgi:hypothetical protein